MKSMNRREFLQALAGGALITGGVNLIYASMVEPNAVEIVEQEIALPGLQPGLFDLRIVQISDLHMGMFVSRAQLERVIDLVLAQKPALTLITGDYLTEGGDDVRALDDLSAVLGRLTAHAPVMSVLGNHDYGKNETALRAVLREQGIIILENAVLPFERGSDRIYIAGIGSISTGHQELKRVAGSTPRDAPAILMAHEPDMADYSAPSHKFSLQISGHSHGGQINLPLLGRPVLPWMGRKYPAGLYRVRDMWQYTNRGIGTVYLPMRYNCPPEITVFVLKGE